MPVLPLILRLALAAVFVIAGVSKLVDLTGTRRAVFDFGVPPVLVGAITLCLPVIELAAAGALLAATIIGPVAVVALLAAFSLAIAVNLARGRRPDCHCFGRAAPIGPWTLARNAAIAAPAIVLLGRGELGASALRIDVVTAIVAAVLVWLAARFATDLLRQHGRLLVRIDHLEAALEAAGIVVPEPHVGIPVGEPAPDFTAIALDGTPRTLAELVQAARPVLLVFTDPACAMCVALAPKLGEWGRELSIVTTHDTIGRLARAYGSKGTPSAVVISSTGTIASSHAQGANAIEMLARRAIAGDFDPAPGLRIGAALPEVVLADLDGAPVPLAAKLDPAADTIVVFWNPSCGFCAAMRDELRELTGTRAMIIVSAGDSARVRAEGFRSPILLDPDLLGAAKLEVNGTPIAVLVGPDATIRSDLVVGARQIFELARR